MQDVAAVEMHLTGRRVDARDRARDENLGAEPTRLLQRSTRELVAGDARRESEVVLDPGRRPGLAAWSLPLDDDRPQSLRCSVHRRGKTPRAGAHDDRVVLGCERLRLESQQLRDPSKLGLHHRFSADDADRRKVVVAGDGAAPVLGHVRVVRFEPLERDLVAMEEPAMPLLSDHERARRGRLGRDALQPARPAHSLAREPADLLGDVRRDRRDSVVVLRIDSHDARRLGGAEPDRKQRAERDRNLAEDVAGEPFSDDAVDSVHGLDRFDAPVE